MSEATSNDDSRALSDLNTRIAAAEDAGDAKWLASVLAPRLAFQRADEARTVDDQVAFLQKVKAGRESRTRIIEPIQIFGNRAVVQCVVTVKDQQFHNLRLFVKRDGTWKLLAWANEPM